MRDEEVDSGLILTAEECPPESFSKYHSFSLYDDVIIRKLSAHGPVLLRGGRGSGKSALLIEAHRRMREKASVFSVYVSLRYLPLLRSDGDEYIGHFCVILSRAIQNELVSSGYSVEFPTSTNQTSLLIGLTELSRSISERIVLLFDDAAHIGREKPLEVFFDLFRTISSSVTSCKASIYPGVTKFGVRFDVFNDSTVIEISRSESSSGSSFFPDVIKARYPKLSERMTFSDRFSPHQFANLLGRAVVGNLQGLILACNRFEDEERIGIPEVTKCLLDMATDYYWPLMDEVAPKLVVYEALVDPGREIMEVIVDHVTRPVRDQGRVIAQDRVILHRQTVANYGKIIEILEYLGFISRREASRGMKSGGKGPVFALNLCSILDAVPSKRLTVGMIEEWTSGNAEPYEIHVSSQAFQHVKLPQLPQEHGLDILEKPVSVLGKSRAYPYGLSANLIDRLRKANIQTVGQLADTQDHILDDIEYVGQAAIKRIHNVIDQAIWM